MASRPHPNPSLIAGSSSWIPQRPEVVQSLLVDDEQELTSFANDQRMWPGTQTWVLCRNMTRASSQAVSKARSNIATRTPHLTAPSLEESRNHREVRSGRLCWPFSYTKSQIIRAISFSLHIGLVLLHTILLVVWFHHWEHRKVVALGFESSAWATGLIVLSQAFITIYSAGMLVLTQQLSLRRNLLVHQTLTATHDQSTAWNGLGSALLSLWRQFSITASVLGVFFITFYLACISVLHVSTPALLSLETFNSTIQNIIPTTRGLPNSVTTANGFISLNYQPFIQGAPILPLLGQFSQLSSIGLHGGTVYDVLSDNQGVGNVTVNSTTFDVTCDVLSNSRVTANGTTWNITADSSEDTLGSSVDVDFQISAIAPNVVRTALSRVDGSTIYLGGDRVIYYSSVNLTDSQGDRGSRVTLDPPMKPEISDPFGDASPVYSLQFMACRFSSSNQTLFVDAQTKELVDAPQIKTSSNWDSAQRSQPLSSSLELASIKNWQGVLDQVSIVTSNANAAYCVTRTCDLLTVADQFVTQQLGIIPDIHAVTDAQPRPQLALHQLENALANLTAALHWSTTHLKHGDSSGTTFGDVTLAGEAIISQPDHLASRLNLNVVPIAIGLGASIILLILAVVLIGNLEGEADAVDSTGILQLMWLLRDRPDLLKLIGQVEKPSAKELREAGMSLVRMAGEDWGVGESSYRSVKVGEISIEARD